MCKFKFIVQTKGRTEVVYHNAVTLYEAKEKFRKQNKQQVSPSKIIRIEFQHNGVWFNQ